ncbi:MAG TPA: hypothetical protein VG206_15605 [Terriglobia bacterium]|nr:hypothetical protein [Terriglobia bacterium]
MRNQFLSRIYYFEDEGRQNLSRVLNTIKKAVDRRPDLKTHKLVVFTAMGEGPALAFNKFKEHDLKIIAVTFPSGFSVTKTTEDGTNIESTPTISEKLRRFFAGVGIPVLTGSLPFDDIGGVPPVNQHMKLIRDTLSLFGGGFSLCVQAVIQACDMGVVDVGERVIVMSGDCAAIMTASNRAKFLSKEDGLSINEILCKPRTLGLTRTPRKEAEKVVSGDLFEEKRAKLLPPV